MKVGEGAFKVFQIFQAGTHEAMGGRVMDWSVWDLKSTIAVYSYDQDPAPLTLGHPANDLPVLGLVKSLFLKNDKLYAYAWVKDVLLHLVREGRYKHVSAAFKKSRHGSPDVWQLKHVGFLGATPPAIKGMDPLGFSEAREESLCFSQTCALSICNAADEPAFKAPPGWNVDARGLAQLELAHTFRQGCLDLSYSESISLACEAFNLQ